jgi:hypothetical protein
MEDFSKIAVGDIQKKYLEDLKDRMRNKYTQIRSENTKVSEVRLIIYVILNISKHV